MSFSEGDIARAAAMARTMAAEDEQQEREEQENRQRNQQLTNAGLKRSSPPTHPTSDPTTAAATSATTATTVPMIALPVHKSDSLSVPAGAPTPPGITAPIGSANNNASTAALIKRTGSAPAMHTIDESSESPSLIVHSPQQRTTSNNGADQTNVVQLHPAPQIHSTPASNSTTTTNTSMSAQQGSASSQQQSQPQQQQHLLSVNTNSVENGTHAQSHIVITPPGALDRPSSEPTMINVHFQSEAENQLQQQQQQQSMQQQQPVQQQGMKISPPLHPITAKPIAMHQQHSADDSQLDALEKGRLHARRSSGANAAPQLTVGTNHPLISQQNGVALMPYGEHNTAGGNNGGGSSRTPNTGWSLASDDANQGMQQQQPMQRNANQLMSNQPTNFLSTQGEPDSAMSANDDTLRDVTDSMYPPTQQQLLTRDAPTVVTTDANGVRHRVGVSQDALGSNLHDAQQSRRPSKVDTQRMTSMPMTGVNKLQPSDGSPRIGDEAADEDHDCMCCGLRCSTLMLRIRIGMINFFQGFEALYVFMFLVMAGIGLVLYFFAGDQPLSRTDRNPNAYYQWPFVGCCLVVAYVVCHVLEKMVLYLLSLTVTTFLWRFWFFGSTLHNALRWLILVTCAYIMRDFQSWETPRTISTIMQMLIYVIVLHILKRMIVKQIIWVLNRRTFSEKIEQLLFVVDFLAVLNNADNYNPYGSLTDAQTKQQEQQPLSRTASIAKRHKSLAKLNQPSVFNRVIKQFNFATYSKHESGAILKSVKEAKKSARSIYRNLDQQRLGYVTLADFKCYLPSERACRAFFLCLPSDRQAELKNTAKKQLAQGSSGSDGGDADGLNHKSFKTSAQLERERLVRERQFMSESKLTGLKIFKQEFYVAIIRFAEERKKISNRLTDWHNLSDVLISVSTAIWVVVTAFVLLVAFADNVYTFLLPMTTLLVSFSFIFGNTLRTVLESAVFVFVVRPYSVSDRLELRLHDDEYEVHSIQLLTTTLRSSTNKIIIVPNSMLLVAEITNLSRSANAAYHIPITLALDVQAQRIGELKQQLEQYTISHPIEWQTRVVITLCSNKNEKDMQSALFADVKCTHNSDWVSGRSAADASLISFNTHLQQTLDLLQMRPKPALPMSPS